MPGPSAEPTKLKILKGNPGHRPLNRFEPQPSTGIPDAPGWLTPYAREVWDQDAPILLAMRVMSKADWVVFALYCTAVSQVRAAEEGMHEVATLTGSAAMGMLEPMATGDGHRRSPLYTMSLESGKAALRYAVELGMTPSARTKIQTLQTDEPESDLQELMRGNGGR